MTRHLFSLKNFQVKKLRLKFVIARSTHSSASQYIEISVENLFEITSNEVNRKSFFIS